MRDGLPLTTRSKKNDPHDELQDPGDGSCHRETGYISKSIDNRFVQFYKSGDGISALHVLDPLILVWIWIGFGLPFHIIHDDIRISGKMNLKMS